MHLTSVSLSLALGYSPRLLWVTTGNLWDLSHAQGHVCPHDASDPIVGVPDVSVVCGPCRVEWQQAGTKLEPINFRCEQEKERTLRSIILFLTAFRSVK